MEFSKETTEQDSTFSSQVEGEGENSQPRGAGGGTPVLKGPGCSSKILKRTPMRYHDPVLWAWLDMFFTPRRYRF